MSEPNSQSLDWVFLFQWMMATAVAWILGRFLVPNLAVVTIGIALGVFQWLVLQYHIRDARWWIFATALGWTAGSVVVMALVPDGMDFVAGVLIGGSTGTAQWLVLRRAVHWSGWWIVVNVVAWTTGFAILPGILLTGVSAGAITGVALGLLTRYPKMVMDQEERNVSDFPIR